ncbi:hypothetical protein [Frigidibacter oleivorans]|uniref:hypothetical protein n=1 Tax=Frigidibacter oleivorans TaxID=2487129 RepID=UPI000F8C872B|nr:hypothetical protein [Frigidibacter oleivorans]
MTNPHDFRVIVSKDGRRFIMASGKWRSEWHDLAELPRWLRFYEALWGRGARQKGQPGPWARFYADAVEKLRALAATTAEEGRR